MLTRPRLVIAGLSGGSGKTVVSLGLARAWANQGVPVKPFKKGPDYIDAAWLSRAARREATNLDTFLMSPPAVRDLFTQAASNPYSMRDGFLGVIEGNRGLFDGGDVIGSHSTSELARLLDAPVVLCIDCTKMTRTVAAIVKGCTTFEPDLRLAGVILNRTAGQRHRSILRQAIETYTDVPVLGTLPKLNPNPIPERHMGLVASQELSTADAILDSLAQTLNDHADLNQLLAIAHQAPTLPMPQAPVLPLEPYLDLSGTPPVIGVVKDDALWFYYPENLDALRHHGAKLVEVSLLSPNPWPRLDGLYLGGGFPETFAQTISANTPILDQLRTLSTQGLPIYAECGGFMILGRTIITDQGAYPMAGVFPVDTKLCQRPQGLGYIQATVTKPNPFLPEGLTFHGHEFHYSCCLADSPQDLDFCLRIDRGAGMLPQRDGLITRNTYASYTHLHALGVPAWAKHFVTAARHHRDTSR